MRTLADLANASLALATAADLLSEIIQAPLVQREAPLARLLAAVKENVDYGRDRLDAAIKAGA